MELWKFSFIVMLLSAFVLGGCTAAQQKYAVDSALAASELSSLKKQYAYVETIMRDKKDEFTDEEWRELLTVHATIKILIGKIDNAVSMTSFDLSPEEISYTWRLAVDSYSRSREIVLNHWDSFEPSDQVLLGTFDDHAEMSNVRINELLNNPDNVGINQSLIMITGLAALALKMLLFI